MKKGSKIFVALLAVALLLCLATLALAACGHEHSFYYDFDQEFHWQKCSGCEETGPKEAHSVDEWRTVRSATYDDEGEAQGECTVCGNTVSKVLPQLTLSAADQESEKLFDFEFNYGSPNYYSIKAYKGDATEVVIPSTYKDLLVTEIWKDPSWDKVKSLSVEDDNPTFLSYMGVLYKKGETPSLYYTPKALEGEIEILDGVTRLGGNFNDCAHISAITIPDSVTYIYDSFKNCTGLRTLTIPDSVQNLDLEAFSGCTNITAATMPASAIRYIPKDSLTTVTVTSGEIGYNAFSGCASLQTVSLGDDMTWIGSDAFKDCTNLTKVNYLGTLKDWCKISFFGGASANPLNSGNAKFYLNDVEVTEVKDLDGLESISNYAFYGFSGVTSVVIPNCVTSIGNDAFSGCTNITAATMPASAISYIPRGNLTTVTITSGEIGSYAFSNRTSLQTVTIGEGVTSIGESAFSGCTGIEKVNYLGDLKGWCEIEFNDTPLNSKAKLYLNDELVTEVKDLDGVTAIPSYAFHRLTDITSVTIPDSVTSIGSYAFYNCTGLSEITIPNSVQSIGNDAFSGCEKLVHIRNLSDVEISSPAAIDGEVLTTLDAEFQNKIEKDDNGILSYTVGDTVYALGYEGTDSHLDLSKNSKINAIYPYAFIFCSNITSVTIPDSITSIGERAFASCTVLQTVNWNATNCTGYSIFNEYTGLTTVNIGEDVKSIPSNAFGECKSITKVNYHGTLKGWCEITFGVASANPLNGGNAKLYLNDVEVAGDLNIPTEISKISGYAFYGLASITSVTIPDSVTSIGSYAFSKCTDLQTVIIGEGVQSIGDEAFWGCTGLQTVNWNATNCTHAPGYLSPIFNGCTGLTTVNIGENVQSIPANAFRGCTGLKDIYYAGDETQWGTIKKGNNWDNNTSNYQLHYNSTGPAAASAASNIATLPSEQAVLIACDKLDLWAKQN